MKFWKMTVIAEKLVKMGKNMSTSVARSGPRPNTSSLIRPKNGQPEPNPGQKRISLTQPYELISPLGILIIGRSVTPDRRFYAGLGGLIWSDFLTDDFTLGGLIQLDLFQLYLVLKPRINPPMVKLLNFLSQNQSCQINPG